MKVNKRVELLVEQVEENIYKRKRVKDISTMNNISDYHLQRVFKSTFGIPIGRYVRGRALSSSLGLLINSDMRIIDIAIEYGFEYEQTYIRAFKKQFGITPGEYRNNPVFLNAIPLFSLSDRSRMKNIALYGSEKERLDILGYVDNWANFYLRVFGEAKHMECYDNGRYTWIHPRNGYRGADSVFNIRLENLSIEEQKDTVEEIKAMKKHTWWNYHSDSVNNLIFPEGRSLPAENDWEVYSLMFPDEKPSYRDNSLNVQRVVSASDFYIWAGIVDRYIHGEEMFHPENHYHLCANGVIRCYIAYDQNVPAAVASTMKNSGIFSLEFVATLPEYRRKGIASALCQIAINEAFRDGAEMVMVRAYDESKVLGKSLGFKYL
jgi:AraC-like DNA-binding protein/ribosomal protein S18 acetylase RimI-like enzyme